MLEPHAVAQDVIAIVLKTVIDIAKKLNISVLEKHLKPDFMKDCSEVFLTGTAVEITPVRSIDDNIFQSREITKILISEFKKITS